MKKIRLLFAALALAALATVPAPAQTASGSFTDAQGRAVSLDQLRGRVVVLFFGGIVDPQSPEELAVLQRLASRYEGRGVDVYWVSVDDASVGDAQLTSFAASHGYRGLVLRDKTGSVLKGFSSGRRTQLPTIVVVDSEGAVAGRPTSGFDPESDLVNRLASTIDPLLK
jgi:peroxiredoxin